MEGLEKLDLGADDIIIFGKTEIPPDYVLDFGAALEAKRGVAKDVRYLCLYRLIHGQATFQMAEKYTSEYVVHASEFKFFYFVQEESDIQESEQASCRFAKKSELEHITYLSSEVWSAFTTSHHPRPFREDLANPMSSHQFWAAVQTFKNEKLSSYLCVRCRWLPHTRVTFSFSRGFHTWPLAPFIACNPKLSRIDEYRKYCPRSDFLISTFSLPRLLIEVMSTDNNDSYPPDLVRMLLQGAFIVHFANTLRAYKDKRSFVLVTVYMRSDGEITRFLLFQRRGKDEERKVLRSLPLRPVNLHSDVPTGLCAKSC